MKMLNLSWVVAALVTALAGCSSASGPSFNAYQVNPQEGPPTYRVECLGLMEGQGVCEKKAQEICHDQTVRPIEPVTPYGKETDVRTVTFQCGPASARPAAGPSHPAPVVVHAAPAAVK